VSAQLSRLLCRPGWPRQGQHSCSPVHTAAGLRLMPALIAFLAYDKRLVDAAERAGLPVATPV